MEKEKIKKLYDGLTKFESKLDFVENYLKQEDKIIKEKNYYGKYRSSKREGSDLKTI